jgi:hypothetical protein
MALGPYINLSAYLKKQDDISISLTYGII